MSELHQKRFPGESDEYRRARNALLEAELALEDNLRDVAALRQKLPIGGRVPEDYVFDTLDAGQGSTIRMSDLFATGRTNLFLYSFMFGPDDAAPCPACTSLVDGFHGIAQHIHAAMNMAVVAKAPIEKLAAFADGRGWSGVRLLSSADNTYNADYFAETPAGVQIPAANIFVKRNGEVCHFFSTEMLYVDRPGQHPRHVDRIWPIWNLLDMTPEGRGDWGPKLAYKSALPAGET